MINNQEVQNVEVYLDYATIPSLNYFLHFAENYKDINSIRLFGLNRFSIPDSICKKYQEGKINFCYIGKDFYNEVSKKLFEILNSIKGKITLNFHLNVSSSIPMMESMLIAYKSFLNSIIGITLHLYDDGSKDVINLYSLSKLPLDELNKIIESDYFHMNDFLMSGKTRFNEAIGKNCYYYLWNKFYKSKYYLINTEILEKYSLKPLKEKLENYQEINLGRFSVLNKEQKMLVLEILGIDLSKLENLIIKTKNKKIFMFLSTTIFYSGDNIISKLIASHSNIIDSYFDENSPNFLNEEYIILIKPHPRGGVINLELQKRYPNILFLPENVPIEILIMLGLIPDIIGGFASTTFFNLKNIEVRDVIFTSPDNINIKGYSDEQSLIIEAMLDLKIISKDNIKYL